jgi:hypothetical protein
LLIDHLVEAKMRAVAALLIVWTIGAVCTEARAEDGAQRQGGGFEFRRHLPTIDNPYCEVTTYILPQFDEQASSTIDVKDRPVIVIDASMLRNNAPYSHFLMAHECCHHTLGHVRLTSESLGQLGPQPFYYIRPVLKTMELDADTCAVKMLKQTKEPDAIEAAREEMLEFGNAPTGAYYPTGVERADNIARAAASDN